MMQSSSVTPAESVRGLSESVRPRSLLVIEDDLSLIQFLDTVLDNVKPGLEWDYVTNGEEALSLLKRKARQSLVNPYDLVMTDVFLEGEVTGFDVWLDSQQIFPTMPFVMMSVLSFDRYFSILRGLNNCPVYLPKPLTVGRCQSVFDEYLSS